MVLGKSMSKAMPLLCVSRSFSPMQWILTCYKSRICKNLHIIRVNLPIMPCCHFGVPNVVVHKENGIQHWRL